MHFLKSLPLIRIYLTTPIIGLEPNRRKAITWIYEDKCDWRILDMRHPPFDGLMMTHVLPENRNVYGSYKFLPRINAISSIRLISRPEYCPCRNEFFRWNSLFDFDLTGVQLPMLQCRFTQWLCACSAPSHCMNQCWHIASDNDKEHWRILRHTGQCLKTSE